MRATEQVWVLVKVQESASVWVQHSALESARATVTASARLWGQLWATGKATVSVKVKGLAWVPLWVHSSGSQEG